MQQEEYHSDRNTFSHWKNALLVSFLSSVLLSWRKKVCPYSPSREPVRTVGKTWFGRAAELLACALGCPEPLVLWARACMGSWISSGAMCPLHLLGPPCVPCVPLFVRCFSHHCSGKRTTSGAEITEMGHISPKPRPGYLTAELLLSQFFVEARLLPSVSTGELVIYACTCIFPQKLKWIISKPDIHEYNPYLCENFHKPKLFTAIALVVPLMAAGT